MPAPLLRRGLWGLALAVVMMAAAVVAVPFVASNQIVKDRIALEMSAWSGLQVSIGATPHIEIWPGLRAILTNVTLSAGARPVINAERVEIDLNALAALSGDLAFSTARFIRPTLYAEKAASGAYLPALSGGGRIARSVERARAVVEQNRVEPDKKLLPSDPFGTVEFSDGRIVSVSSGAEAELVTKLAGKVSWPALNSSGTVNATGTWRGEEVAIDIASREPLLLFGGGTASLSLALRSEPATFSFDGTINLMDAFFDGNAKLAAPSLRRMLEWSDADISTGSAIGAVSVESSVSGNAQRVKFEDAKIALDDHPGMGVLDLSLTGKLPAISGTLAFDSLDLLAFLSAFTPLQSAGGEGPGEIDTGFASKINIDLRLSAAKATAGSIALTKIAATAQVNEGLAAFDISDAAAFGGNVQTGLRFDAKPDGAKVEIRLLASDIDGGAFGAAIGMTRLVPIGRGTVSVILKGPGKAWESILDNASGSVSANFGPGALSGFDLERFLERTAEGGFFSLDDVSSNSLLIDGAELKATISNGVASIEKAEARSARHRLELSGIVSYAGRGLALSGRVMPAGGAGAVEADDPATTRFFVGGTWRAPFISPISQPAVFE